LSTIFHPLVELLCTVIIPEMPEGVEHQLARFSIASFLP